MPVNEILAPYYLKVSYDSGLARHNVRWYFETGAIVSPGGITSPNDWTVQGSASPIANTVSEIVQQVFTRAAGALRAGTRVTGIEIWRSQAGVNEFVHSNDLPAVVSYGIATGIAAAYYMFVFGSSTRQKFRLSLFDTLDARPQRYAGTVPPLLDDGFLEWYFLRGSVPFATQDGVRINRIVSTNTGYNRKLARSYGRVIVP
jgi:hypothetical protein